MKILIISYEFPPLAGGASTYARELAVGLSKNECRVHIITCYHGNKAENEKYDANLLKQYGVKIIRVKPFWKLFFLQIFFKLIVTFGRRFDKEYDQIILADVRAIRLALLFFNKSQKEKSTNIFHGGQVESFILNPNLQIKISGLNKKFIKSIKTVRANIAVSKHLKDSFTKIKPELKGYIDVVSHGIDPELFFPRSEKEKLKIRKKLGISTEKFVIFSASRFSREKGIDKLYDTFCDLSKEFENIILIIAGEGDFRVEFERALKKSKFYDRIILPGSLPREELSHFYAISDLYVMLSRIPFEAFGLVNIEANACGVPVIASKIGGVPESVEDGITGFLVNPVNSDEIKDKMRELIINPDIRANIIDLGIQRVNDRFTNKMMASDTLKVMGKK